MPDTEILANARPSEIRLSPDGTRLYASDADGFVRVYDVASGALITSWDVGQDLGGMDISPDGSFLVLVERQPGPVTGSGPDATTAIYAYKVDTTTGAVETFTFQATGLDGPFFDAAVLSDGTALLSQTFNGSGWTYLRQLDFTTGVFTASLQGNPEGIQVGQSSALSRSPDGQTVLIGEPNISNGQLDMFKTGVGITHTANANGFNWGIQAYNGTYVAQYIYNEGLHVYNARLQSHNSMSSLAYGKVSDMAFSADGRWLYILDNEANQVIRINIRLWEIDGTIPIDADVGSWTGSFSPGGRLVVDPLDDYFGVVTDGALAVVGNPFNIRLTEGADTHVGDADSDTIYALGGNDVVDAGLGTDTVFGGAGNDQLTASSGNDRLIGDAGADVLSGGGQLFSHTLDPAYPGWVTNGVSYDIYAEHDVLTGSAGSDFLFAGYGDTVDGGANTPTGDRLFISFLGATAGVSADFRVLEASGSITIGSGTISNVEGIGYLEGSNFADFLVPIDTDQASGADVFGRGGNDHIIASSYSSTMVDGELHGNDGDDIIDGRPSPTYALIFGDAGNDTLYSGLSGLGSVDGGDGNDTIYSSVLTYGGAGNDLIFITTPVPFAFTPGVDAGDGNDTVVGRAVSNYVDGGAGTDTMSYADASVGVTVDLSNTGQQVTGWGSDTLFNFENLVGSAFADVLTGTSAANRLDGGAGADTLDGGAGNDILAGGLGNDTYHVDSVGDVVSELAGQGTDRVLASVSYTLGTGVHVEMLTTSDDLATTAINLTGNGGANTLTGNAGANVLDGRGGADAMTGLGGDDWYYVDHASDWVIEAAGGGSDRVFSAGTYTLGAESYVEKLTTANNAGTSQINLTGNDFAQAIYGNAGDNLLDGRGGADTLVGLGGNDWYYVDNALDVVSEAAGGGNDRIFASASYVLGAGVHVETLGTTTTGGTAAINLTGNALANAIYGNAGNNVLDGKGGADTLTGYAGDDWYYVDNAGDVVVEGGGNDRVLASVSYTLAAGVQVEKLTTADNAGTAAINLTGNALAQAIFGNAGNNVLDGKGGADTLAGLGGDDSYHVDHALDVINEGAGGGSDRVYASVSYTLGAGVQVEKLTTSDNLATSAIALTGNELANQIYGNAGNNVIDGKGGADTLVGLAGADSFAFTTALGSGNIDAISGFVVADDTIRLENAVFTGLAAGGLSAGAFAIGSAASQADDRVIYNAATGALLFDADGAGGAAAVQFATLAGGLALTSADFLVV